MDWELLSQFSRYSRCCLSSMLVLKRGLQKLLYEAYLIL